jgi:hypothetical protein
LRPLEKYTAGYELIFRFRDVNDAHQYYSQLKKRNVPCELAKVSASSMPSVIDLVFVLTE